MQNCNKRIKSMRDMDRVRCMQGMLTKAKGTDAQCQSVCFWLFVSLRPAQSSRRQQAAVLSSPSTPAQE